MPKPKPCKDCGRLPKLLPRQFCRWCILKREPMHVQVDEAQKRRAAVPEGLHLKRSMKVIASDTPQGLSFCAGCQSFCPEWMFAAGATQCRPCVSAKAHAARTEKVYGIDSAEYDRILEVQGGKCAICRNAPKTKRLAVDHDHKTGKVRGLLCSGQRGCNYGILGSAHDDPELLWRALMYLLSPPAGLDGDPQ